MQTKVAPVGAINSNVIRIRPQCENGYTAPRACHLVDEECGLKRTRSRAPPRPAAKGDWGDRAHLLDLRIRNLVADVADNPVVIANVFLAPRRRTPIWCPKYELFDVAFSPETEHGP